MDGLRLLVASTPLSHREIGVDEYRLPSKFSSLSGVEGSGARGVHDAESDDGVEAFEHGVFWSLSINGLMGFA
jgi:hypothetical protein